MNSVLQTTGLSWSLPRRWPPRPPCPLPASTPLPIPLPARSAPGGATAKALFMLFVVSQAGRPPLPLREAESTEAVQPLYVVCMYVRGPGYRSEGL